MTIHHSQTGRRSGPPVRRAHERWRFIRRWLNYRVPTHRKEATRG